MCAQLLSHIRLFATPRTVALQAPLSMGFSRQEYWNRLLFPSPRHEEHIFSFKKESNKCAAAAAKMLQSCPPLWRHRWQPTRLHHPWDSPGKITGVGCHCLLCNKCAFSNYWIELLINWANFFMIVSISITLGYNFFYCKKFTLLRIQLLQDIYMIST